MKVLIFTVCVFQNKYYLTLTFKWRNLWSNSAMLHITVYYCFTDKWHFSISVYSDIQMHRVYRNRVWWIPLPVMGWRSGLAVVRSSSCLHSAVDDHWCLPVCRFVGGKWQNSSVCAKHLLVPRSRTSTSQPCAFASAGPLLWNCLPLKTRAQILSSSLSSTPRLLKSLLFPGAYRTGGCLWLVFTASGAVYKYVNRIESRKSRESSVGLRKVSNKKLLTRSVLTIVSIVSSSLVTKMKLIMLNNKLC